MNSARTTSTKHSPARAGRRPGLHGSALHWLSVTILAVGCHGAEPITVGHGTAAGGIAVDNACFWMDMGDSFPWAEPAPGIFDPGSGCVQSGLLKVHVFNSGLNPASVEATALNGVPLDTLRNRDTHDVIWWRTFPNPVPARGYAEISVRLRYPYKTTAELTVKAGAGALSVKVPHQPPPFRIETIGWTEKGRRLTIVAAQQPSGSEHAPPGARITQVWVDGKDVTGLSRILAPEFFQGVCPILVTLLTELKTGSFHTYKVVAADGTAAACTLRTLDDFMRLGMYGAEDLSGIERLGLNETSHFHTRNRTHLDEYRRHGLRSAFHIADNGPPPRDVIGHSAVYGYLLHDEPDVWDASATQWPEPYRIGFRAPDILRFMDICVDADPVKPVMMTLDLTYKPANYYVYAQIPDIVTPDCYPLTHAQPLNWVRDTTEACRRAAGPRRVEMITQANWEDRSPSMKYRRPPFPREMEIQYLYALGSGSRGFSCYEWYDWADHHGARNYPKVMEAVGKISRRFHLVAPLILQAQPTRIARCDNEQVWLRTLVCGENVLLVLVNDDYESLPDAFNFKALKNVVVQMPRPPWLKTVQAWRVGDGDFGKMDARETREGIEIELPLLETGAVILVTGDGQLPVRLQTRSHLPRRSRD